MVADATHRQEGIIPNLYYRWSKDFLEAGKKRLSGDTPQMFMTDGETRSWINALW